MDPETPTHKTIFITASNYNRNAQATRATSTLIMTL